MRRVRRAVAGRRRPLRALRHDPGGQAVEEGEWPQAVRPAARQESVHRLRPALAGGRTVSAVRSPVLGPLRPASRHSRLAGPLHRHRPDDGRGPRHLRQPRRGGRLPGVRQARTERRRDRFRHFGHGVLDVVVAAPLGPSRSGRPQRRSAARKQAHPGSMRFMHPRPRRPGRRRRAPSVSSTGGIPRRGAARSAPAPRSWGCGPPVRACRAV